MVVAPLGLAEPFNVAEPDSTEVAAELVTRGAASVVNVSTEPKAVPSELESIAQK